MDVFKKLEKVYVITTDGNIPLPSGEYELETEILVVEDGTIVDILEKVEDVPVDEPDVPEVKKIIKINGCFYKIKKYIWYLFI